MVRIDSSQRHRKTFSGSGLLYLLMLIPALFASSPLFGQGVVFTGRIVGIVTDPSGGVIPGATVVAKNELTGVAYAPVKTDAKGYYVIPTVPEGHYVLKVTQDGFKTLDRSGIEVGIATEVRVDMSLEIGSTTQSVTVVGAAPVVETESASMSSGFDRTSITDLPISFSKSILDLTTFGAGISSRSGTYGNNNYSVNGSPSATEVTTIDGGNLTNPGTGSYWYMYIPAVDEVQSYKIQNTTYSATAGGMYQMQMTTISGANKLHGTAYYYKTTPAMTSRTFTQTATGTFSKYVAGTTVGGPIRKDKTFWTFTFLTEPSIGPRTWMGTLPTAAELAGDFTDPAFPTIYDPATTTPNPNGPGYIRTAFKDEAASGFMNKIPASRMDPVSLNFLTYLPPPNLPGLVNNFNNQLPSGLPPYCPKCDQAPAHSMSENGWHYYAIKVDNNISDRNHVFGRFMFENPWVTWGAHYPGVAGYDAWEAGKNNMWTVEAGDTFNFSSNLLNEFRAAQVYDFSGLVTRKENYAADLGLKNFGTDFPWISMGGYQNIYMGQGSDPETLTPAATSIDDSVTWIRAGHTFKFGGGFTWEQYNNQYGTFPQGSLDFSGIFTNNLINPTAGLGFADFLLGQGDHVFAQAEGPIFGDRMRHGYFFLQDDIKLTRRLALTLGFRFEKYGRDFDVHGYRSNFSPTVINDATGTPGAEIFAGRNGAPKGFVKAANNYLPRIGLAYMLNKKTALRAGVGIFAAEGSMGMSRGDMYGFNPTPEQHTTTDQITPALIMSRGLPYPEPGAYTGSLVNTIANGGSVDWYPEIQAAPTLYQWSMGIQRELPDQTRLEINYVGTRGIHLWEPRNVNQVPANELGPGDALPKVAYPQYPGGVTLYANDGYSMYSALQATLAHHMRRGLDVNANYTWSHSDNIGSFAMWAGSDPIQNIYNLKAEWGPSDDWTPQSFGVSLVYEIPQLVKGNSIAARYLTRGWQTNNMVRSQSGYPVNPGTSSNLTNALTGSLRPNCNGPTKGPQTRAEWFNVSSFSLPAPYTWGSCSRDDILSPGFYMWDFSLFKNTYFHTWLNENTNIQIRAEFMNVLNHVTLGQPNTTIGSGAAGTITYENLPPRTIDLGIKFIF